MIVKLTPASEDRRVWMVSVSPDSKREVPVDFMTVAEEQRQFLGEDVAHYEAEPAVEGWDIKRRVSNLTW
jgi:hypothetical protein